MTCTTVKLTCVFFIVSDAQATMSGGIQVNETMFLLDDVVCNGTENDLLDCAHAGIHFHNCAPAEEAGVICGMRVCTYCTTKNFGVHLIW